MVFLRPAETWLIVRTALPSSKRSSSPAASSLSMCSRTRAAPAAAAPNVLHVARRVVALGDKRVQVGEDLDDLPAGHEAGQIQPVRADVGDGAQTHS